MTRKGRAKAGTWLPDHDMFSMCCDAPVLYLAYKCTRKCSKCGRPIDAMKFEKDSEMYRSLPGSP